MYGVLQLKEKVSIEVMGIKKELSLSWYKGQIGAYCAIENYNKKDKQ